MAEDKTNLIPDFSGIQIHVKALKKLKVILSKERISSKWTKNLKSEEKRKCIYLTSDIGHQTTDIGHRTSDITQRTSDIGTQTSDIGNRKDFKYG